MPDVDGLWGRVAETNLMRVIPPVSIVIGRGLHRWATSVEDARSPLTTKE
ncbi:hypothetical protein HC031_27820 [Planosporangium thailandense]|uniref:Uncharacterized protein n=1 Tax=Planosporangium thailandense TaxID=765197 RepID=A0ABX0Y8A6_9ACTN|nr:hypothetical protein [Planosporangium thailandense]NJC73504.1 hypothetical protein [Planosporangium thailandense]